MNTVQNLRKTLALFDFMRKHETAIRDGVYSINGLARLASEEFGCPVSRTKIRSCWAALDYPMPLRRQATRTVSPTTSDNLLLESVVQRMDSMEATVNTILERVLIALRDRSSPMPTPTPTSNRNSRNSRFSDAELVN